MKTFILVHLLLLLISIHPVVRPADEGEAVCEFAFTGALVAT